MPAADIQGFVALFSIDIVILLAVLVVFVLTILRVGTGPAAALVLSLVTAPILFARATDTALLSDGVAAIAASPMLQLGALAGTICILYLLIRRIMPPDSGYGSNLLPAIGAGVAALAALLAAWNATAHTELIWSFSAPITGMFAPHLYLWWILGSLILLGLFRR